jgi:hypothetical protein
MSFTATRNEMKALHRRLAIALYMTMVSVSLLRGDSTSQLYQHKSEVLCESDGQHACDGLVQNNNVRTVSQLFPDYRAVILPSLATQTLAALSLSRQMSIFDNTLGLPAGHVSLDPFTNATSFNAQIRSFLHRPGDWTVSPINPMLPKVNMFDETPSRYAESTARSRHKHRLAQMLGHVDILPTQSLPQEILGWPTR